jgi:hypothetical protein
MSRIRGEDTTPERIVRSLLHRMRRFHLRSSAAKKSYCAAQPAGHLVLRLADVHGTSPLAADK